jgi:hypothetical protein
MTDWSAQLLAAVAAVALLVGVPFGLAIGFALAETGAPGLPTALAQFPWVLELTIACAWVACVFLPLRWLEQRSIARRVPVGAIVFALAFAAGMLGFYRSDAAPSRVLFSAQYALLVWLAFLLLSFLADWLKVASKDLRPKSSGDADECHS